MPSDLDISAEMGIPVKRYRRYAKFRSVTLI